MINAHNCLGSIGGEKKKKKKTKFFPPFKIFQKKPSTAFKILSPSATFMRDIKWNLIAPSICFTFIVTSLVRSAGFSSLRWLPVIGITDCPLDESLNILGNEAALELYQAPATHCMNVCIVHWFWLTMWIERKRLVNGFTLPSDQSLSYRP